MNLHPARVKSLDQFERGDSAADHHRRLSALRKAEDVFRVGKMIEFDHALQFASGNLQLHGLCANRDQQLIVSQPGLSIDFKRVFRRQDSRYASL